jgi:hypothetical protein
MAIRDEGAKQSWSRGRSTFPEAEVGQTYLRATIPPKVPFLPMHEPEGEDAEVGVEIAQNNVQNKWNGLSATCLQRVFFRSGSLS